MRLLPLALLALLAAGGPAWAGALQVSPVTVDLQPARRTAMLTVVNGGERPMNVQVRVMRWTRAGGQDRLEPTDEVVASPPAVTLAPGASQVVRVVKVATSAPEREESYRVLVDELPDPALRRAGEVALVVRQSIPVFFAGASGGPPRVAWRVEPKGAGGELVAVNTGGRRLRIADLEVRTGSGRVLARQPGLAGYVLAGAEMRWPIDWKPGEAGDPLTLSAASDMGAVRVSLPPPS